MMIVPDKTIAYFPVIPNEGLDQFDLPVSTFLRPLNKDHKRDWFTANFYRCLPLSIGNMQGFVFSVPFDFAVSWNGGNDINDVFIHVDESTKDIPLNMNHMYIKSEFGHGIFTVHFPLILKTPPGVNLMTIAPPNYPTPGISPMTGVIEADNLKFTFTLNFKIDLINSTILIKKDYPLMGIIPIPRYFCDSFQLIDAKEILPLDEIAEEQRISRIHATKRDKSNELNLGADKTYYRGMDIENNKFKDHQLPGKKK